MEPYPLSLDDIRVPDDHRALNEDAVVGLMKSFKEIGQQYPTAGPQRPLVALRICRWRRADAIIVALRICRWRRADAII